MQRPWTDHELATHWSLSAHELALLPQRDASSRLGVAASLKFVPLEGRFPTSGREIPAVALQYLATQRAVAPEVITDYDWQGRTGKRYRGQLRVAVGVRPITVGGFRALATWLREEMVPWDHEPRPRQAAILARCRTQHVEPPTDGRVARLIHATVRAHEAALFATTAAQRSPSTRQALDALLDSSPAGAEDGDSDGPGWRSTVFSTLKGDPGRVSLKSVLQELEKLRQIEALQLPADLFATLPPKILRTSRLRVAAEPPREVRQPPESTRYMFLAAFCCQRQQEIIDGLVDLLIQIVHRITVRAEKKVVTELLGDLQKVRGNTTLLYRLAEAAVEPPEGTVREVL
jgi:hypothetical protein